MLEAPHFLSEILDQREEAERVAERLDPDPGLSFFHDLPLDPAVDAFGEVRTSPETRRLVDLLEDRFRDLQELPIQPLMVAADGAGEFLPAYREEAETRAHLAAPRISSGA